ncbi:MAG: RNA methyltransferase [Bacteroidales bacterium]|nr:RNA methyltransferase [Bacteroidales bacterium]
MLEQLTEHLSQFMLKERYNQMIKVLSGRTEYVVPVLENIYQPQNANAVIRTAECLGFQKLCVIENTHKFQVHRDICMGSTKWLDIEKFSEKPFNTTDCIEKLKKQGYRIVATTPHEKGQMLDDFDISKGKCAILFGTEKFGLTDEAIAMSDEFLTIPMYGFTESFNISVSCALVLYKLREKLMQSDVDFHIEDQRFYEILLDWQKKSIRECNKIIDRYYHDRN